MGKRKSLPVLLLIAALALSGCGEQQQEASPTAEPVQAASAMAQGALGDAARALMAPYTDVLSQAAQKSGESLAYTIPGDLLNQMALDAEAEGAKAREGRWRFTRRDSGAYAYEATAWEAMDQYVPEDGATPNPADETPLDSQLNGDYAVSGGGLFDRTRDYDVAEDLSGGTVTLTDSLNGQTTGSELFRFCVRNGEMIFADAALDTTMQDGAATGDGYLAAVGALRADGLEVVEYRLTSLDELPDPAALNFSSFLRTVSPIAHLSIQTEKPSK